MEDFNRGLTFSKKLSSFVVKLGNAAFLQYLMLVDRGKEVRINF
jgi:hypothetical protein